jgi:hypothetical protein
MSSQDSNDNSDTISVSSDISTELFQIIRNNEKKKRGSKDEVSKSSSSDDSSHFTDLVSHVSDMKGDMHKILRLIHLLDKQATENKSRTHILQKEIDDLRSELGKISLDTESKSKPDSRRMSVASSNVSFSVDSSAEKSNTKSSDDSSFNFDTSSGKDDSTDEKSVPSESEVSEGKSIDSRSTVDSRSNGTETSASNTTSGTSFSSVCSKDEFDRFKVDVLALINDLAARLDHQIRVFSASMGGKRRIEK